MRDFLSLVKDTRSIRAFDNSKPVTKEQLIDIIATTRFTASSVNLQVLKFKFVLEADRLKAVRRCTKWAGLLPNYSGPSDDLSPTAYIIICHDTDISANVEMFDKDVGIAAQTMALAGCEIGLGSCMIGSFDKTEIPKILNLGDNLVPKLILALGYPREKIILEDAEDSVKYYRDENGNHHVPKRTLEEIIIK